MGKTTCKLYKLEISELQLVDITWFFFLQMCPGYIIKGEWCFRYYSKV